jgi:Fungal specific transcription factor domain
LSVVDQFWAAQTMDPSQFFDFIPQILCVLAMASNLDESCLLEDERPRGHGLASTYCDLVGSWLESLKGKQRLKFSTLQTQALLLMAKQSSVEHVEDMWNTTGSLVRSAMTIGLHRDPSECPQIPIFWAELRKRLWVTIAEMDLQISLNCGMPTMVCATDFTCGIPANINDTDLTLAMRHPPPPRSFAQWSDCLPQVFLAKSLRQRLTAARLLSNIQDGLDYDEVVDHAKDLEKILQDLPPPLKFDYLSDEDSQRPGRLMTRVLLDMYIRRLLLNIYGPFAQADPRDTNFAEARKGFITSSLVILCYQDIFDPEFADLDIISSPRYWDLFHVFCKNDMMHASLGVCLEIKRWSRKSRTLESGSPATNARSSPHIPVASEPLDPVFTAWTKSSLIKTVDDNINPLMRRLGRFGSDPKDLLCLSIVLNSVRTNQSPERTEILMESGIRELITAYQQHLQKTRKPETRNTGLEVAGTQLRPPSQADTQDAALSFGFNFRLLTDSNFDFGEIDFGFAQDSQLDQIWG